MILHIVEPNETISSIAKKYDISTQRLIQDNGLSKPFILVIGQVILIANPVKTYKVINNESLSEISQKNGISVLQLLGNNPFLSERKAYPGEILAIQYNNNKGKVKINGFAYAFIDKNLFRKTLPYLTYLSILGYIITEDGEILDINDSEIVRIAKEYGVAPIMVLTASELKGAGSLEAAYKILYNENLTNRHIDNIVKMLKKKGYYGVNFVAQFMSEKNRIYYEGFLYKVKKRLDQEGLITIVTLIPFTFIRNQITYEKMDYSKFDQVNSITFIQFNWGYNYGPPAPIASISEQKEFVNYVTTMISPNRVSIGVPVNGYDWELPYVVGYSKATSLNTESIMELAIDKGIVIDFDEISKTPYFEYAELRSGIPIQHIVWFVDARTIDEMLKLIISYGLQGTGIWNIMNYNTQLWFVINTQYEIEKVIPEDTINITNC